MRSFRFPYAAGLNAVYFKYKFIVIYLIFRTVDALHNRSVFVFISLNIRQAVSHSL
jgi:hypothetical protein